MTGAPAGQGVSSVAVDPTNTNIVYVTYPGFSGIDPDLAPTEHIFETTDGGTTWTDISGVINGGSNNLPDLPLHSVVIDPTTSPHTIIVLTIRPYFSRPTGVGRGRYLGWGCRRSISLRWRWTLVQLRLCCARAPSAAAPLTQAATTALIAVNSDLNFGLLCPGQPASRQVEVSNVGVKDLHIASFTRISGSTDFTILPNPATR